MAIQNEKKVKLSLTVHSDNVPKSNGEGGYYTLPPHKQTFTHINPYIEAYKPTQFAKDLLSLTDYAGYYDKMEFVATVDGNYQSQPILEPYVNPEARPQPKFKAMYGGVIFEDEPTPVESQNAACLYVNASVSTATVPFYFQGDGTLYIADQQFYEGQPPCVLIAPNPDYDPTSNDSTQSAFYNWELIVHQGGFGYVRIASTETANYRESDDNHGKVRIYPPGSNFADLKNSNANWQAATGLANGVASTLTTTPNPNWT